MKMLILNYLCQCSHPFGNRYYSFISFSVLLTELIYYMSFFVCVCVCMLIAMNVGFIGSVKSNIEKKIMIYYT